MRHDVRASTLYWVLVVGGAALTTGCGGSEREGSGALSLDGGPGDAAADQAPNGDAAAEDGAVDAAKDGVDCWLSWS
jgi:hypothetical protein